MPSLRIEDRQFGLYKIVLSFFTTATIGVSLENKVITYFSDRFLFTNSFKYTYNDIYRFSSMQSFFCKYSLLEGERHHLLSRFTNILCV